MTAPFTLTLGDIREVLAGVLGLCRDAERPGARYLYTAYAAGAIASMRENPPAFAGSGEDRAFLSLALATMLDDADQQLKEITS